MRERNVIILSDGKKRLEIHGIDISHIAIDWARERFAQEKIIGNFHHGDVRSMPFFSNCFFDLIFDGVVFTAS